MLTRKELCQFFLLRAQQKFGKAMTELDSYYAGSDVGIALAYLGLLKDPDTLAYIKNNPSTLYKHPNGNELSVIELLNLLPEDRENREKQKEQEEQKEQKEQEMSDAQEKIKDVSIEIDEDKKPVSEDQIRQILGDRKYYRVLDVIETLSKDESDLVTRLIKSKY